jgi:glycosyltransferase involved in cell wall biosynthesis
VTTFDVILPVLNEVGNIGWVLDRLPAGYRAIVVDNGSTDGSGELAREHGALVVHEPQRGFGSACWAGLTAATADIVCYMDADGSLDPTHLPEVAEIVADGRADLVLARRIADRGAWPLHTKLANRVLAAQLNWRCKTDLHDLGPMRAARRQALLDLGMTDRRSGWPLEMVVKAATAGWKVLEVPVPYHQRRTGTSKETGTIAGTARAVKDMSAILRAM